MGRKILIFGNFPFGSSGEFIDTNHFATYFAHRGDEVDFITPPAYLVDTLSFNKKRFNLLKRHYRGKIKIEENLHQYTPLSTLPIRNNPLLGSNLNLKLFSLFFRATEYTRKVYDICITSQGFMLLWTDYIRSRLFIYRYNDIIDGFKRHPEGLMRYEKEFIKRRSPLILAVNDRLKGHLSLRYPDYNNIKVLPNGVDTELFYKADPEPELVKIRKKKLVFCGGIDFWVDTELLYETAHRLKDCVLILIGPAYVDIDRIIRLPNVLYLGPRRYEEIPSLLKACDIGLIPFKKERLTEFVEKPLKYYEYLAAGLVVVAKGVVPSGEKNPYFKNVRDSELFIETIEKMDIIPINKREEISKSVAEADWKRIFERLEEFIKEGVEGKDENTC